jgi:hypothetical protein
LAVKSSSIITSKRTKSSTLLRKASKSVIEPCRYPSLTQSFPRSQTPIHQLTLETEQPRPPPTPLQRQENRPRRSPKRPLGSPRLHQFLRGRFRVLVTTAIRPQNIPQTARIPQAARDAMAQILRAGRENRQNPHKNRTRAAIMRSES